MISHPHPFRHLPGSFYEKEVTVISPLVSATQQKFPPSHHCFLRNPSKYVIEGRVSYHKVNAQLWSHQERKTVDSYHQRQALLCSSQIGPRMPKSALLTHVCEWTLHLLTFFHCSTRRVTNRGVRLGSKPIAEVHQAQAAARCTPVQAAHLTLGSSWKINQPASSCWGDRPWAGATGQSSPCKALAAKAGSTSTGLRLVPGKPRAFNRTYFSHEEAVLLSHIHRALHLFADGNRKMCMLKISSLLSTPP